MSNAGQSAWLKAKADGKGGASGRPVGVEPGLYVVLAEMIEVLMTGMISDKGGMLNTLAPDTETEAKPPVAEEAEAEALPEAGLEALAEEAEVVVATDDDAA